MFAPASKAPNSKAVIVKPIKSGVRSGTLRSAPVTISSNRANTRPVTRSKFNEHELPLWSRRVVTTVNNIITKHDHSQHQQERKKLINPQQPHYKRPNFSGRTRFLTESRCPNKDANGIKNALKNIESLENVESPNYMEVGVQTFEPEILDYDLIIGDIKLLLPSSGLVYAIERSRDETKKKAMLKVQRKFEDHSLKQEEHLNDLNEFLEKAVITKRSRKQAAPARESLELDRKLIHSMDELLSREVPRAESITNIKGRIKKKEQQLLNLYETVENIQIFSDK